ncbi:MAG: hypothetical protein DCF29_19360 [Alphaproteobacteria bacterium]|nr:MAG: hypothetical protein DCF29_19360 [Alphaproteobacteria bacterium]
MIRILSALRWPLFAAYVLAGGAAVMVATPIGLTALGLSLDSLSFLPARILTAPWSLVPLATDLDSVTTLAVFIIGYGFNVALLMVVAREWTPDPSPPAMDEEGPAL